MKKIISITLSTLFVSILITGCSPEVGSEAWCSEIKAKAGGDITTNEAADFAKHCLLK